jgi:hypothetical protein
MAIIIVITIIIIIIIQYRRPLPAVADFAAIRHI